MIWADLAQVRMRPMSLIEAIASATLSHESKGMRVALLRRDFPIPFFEKLKEEVLSLVDSNDGSDVTYGGHGTNWTVPFGTVTQYNILSTHGDYKNTKAGLSIYGRMFPEPELYPTINNFIMSFPHAVNCRINIMGPKSGLGQHKETIIVRQKSGDLGIKARFHVPIVTNEKALVFLDGGVYQLEAGRLYFFNNGCVHAASNGSDNPRIHLVFDMLMTKNVASLFVGHVVPDTHSLEPVDEDAPLDGPSRWDGSETIHWFRLQ